MFLRIPNKISNVLRDAAKVVAEKSRIAAASDLKNYNDGDILDIGVSVDGRCKRRGFSSLNGVVAALSIDNGRSVHLSVWAGAGGGGGMWVVG